MKTTLRNTLVFKPVLTLKWGMIIHTSLLNTGLYKIDNP